LLSPSVQRLRRLKEPKRVRTLPPHPRRKHPNLQHISPRVRSLRSMRINWSLPRRFAARRNKSLLRSILKRNVLVIWQRVLVSLCNIGKSTAEISRLPFVNWLQSRLPNGANQLRSHDRRVRVPFLLPKGAEIYRRPNFLVEEIVVVQ
jgi:hypothetical protein